MESAYRPIRSKADSWPAASKRFVRGGAACNARGGVAEGGTVWEGRGPLGEDGEDACPQAVRHVPARCDGPRR
ncbi:hypothetical protein AB1Y20_003249 [Prymnesium parvum]|uniref:Uncharacterized protein n=1 Tax=Prymnesium parvum TaxID=97485 RepID=A0AB34JDJ1_PRYPA